LERAVAMKQKWMYLPPLLSGLGWLIATIVPKLPFGVILLTLASLGGVAILAEIVRREFALHTVTMFLGAIAWLTGNLLWTFGWQIYQVVFFWMAFLVLTIAGERLELSRVLRPTQMQQILFGGIIAIFMAGIILALFNLQLGTRLSGLGLLLLPLWSLRNDIAWRNVRHKLPLTRYIAWCLALGFIWLGISGGLSLGFGAQVAGPRYDAVLHAVFVGFVISMIFSHAPVIFPGVLGLRMAWSPIFYQHGLLLQLSLLLRVSGDLWEWLPGRRWGGVLNGLTLLVFAVSTASVVWKTNRQSARAITPS